MTLKSGVLPQDKKEKIEEVYKTLTLLPETMETLTGSSFATGRCQQEEKHIRNFEVRVIKKIWVVRVVEKSPGEGDFNFEVELVKKHCDEVC